MPDKRRHQRVEAVNLISYVSLDENDKPLDQGMGKTLDLSQGGLLMETRVPIETKYIMLMSLNLKDELIKIKGEVVYCRQGDSKNFHIGVRFKEANDRIRKIVVGMIKVFTMRKIRGEKNEVNVNPGVLS